LTFVHFDVSLETLVFRTSTIVTKYILKQQVRQALLIIRPAIKNLTN
jgi:hypothetical protein